MALPEILQGLLDPHAYPHPCGRIELIETHISWVILTGEFAYKLKKPVRFTFLDFSTLPLREHFCREELRCNRAFAPQLYIDVLPVYCCADQTLRIERRPAAGDRLLEWAVQMHQFDPAAQLDRLLERNAVSTDMLRVFGGELAACHAALPRIKASASEIGQRIFTPVNDNFVEIAATSLQSAHAELLTRIRELSVALGNQLFPLLEERIGTGYVRECHGDLHLSNLALIDGKIVAFDCLEFNPNLRWVDTFNDVAFLYMDCHERGRADLAYAFLDGYLGGSGDYRGSELLGYFAAYRSMVRAKVAALRWEQDHSADAKLRFVRHVEWVQDKLDRSRGMLVLMCGLSGAGKSWVAERLVPRLPAIRLRSDVGRKALAGLDTLAHTASTVGGGIYAQSRSDALFEYLAQVAESLLLGGDNVIIDATFIERHRRAEFLELANRQQLKVAIVYCTAPVAILRERITSRTTAGSDPSEATLAVLDAQLAKLEPPDWPEPVIALATDDVLNNDRLLELTKAILA